MEDPEDREEHVYLTFLKEQAKNNQTTSERKGNYCFVNNALTKSNQFPLEKEQSEGSVDMELDVD